MILITAYGPDQKINEYVRKGAFDFLEKPFELEKLLKRIENANRIFQLEYSRDALKLYHKSAYRIIGNSPEIVRIKKMIRLISQSQSSVLIEGENRNRQRIDLPGIFILKAIEAINSLSA